MLTDLIGPVGGKLHTGRSRNDQVATDIHLYLRDQVKMVIDLVAELQQALNRKGRSPYRNTDAWLYPFTKSATYFVCSSFNGLFLDVRTG